MNSFISRDQNSHRLFEQAARERYFNYVEMCLRESREQLNRLDSMLDHPLYEKLKEEILNRPPDAHEMQLRCEWLVLI